MNEQKFIQIIGINERNTIRDVSCYNTHVDWLTLLAKKRCQIGCLGNGTLGPGQNFKGLQWCRAWEKLRKDRTSREVPNCIRQRSSNCSLNYLKLKCLIETGYCNLIILAIHQLELSFQCPFWNVRENIIPLEIYAVN